MEDPQEKPWRRDVDALLADVDALLAGKPPRDLPPPLSTDPMFWIDCTWNPPARKLAEIVRAVYPELVDRGRDDAET